jgi:AcrR family transcriptional regulator
VPPRQRLRRDERQAQTRAALIEAAGRLFEIHGFGATSIADIADEAGYTTGALYSNFTNKEDLFLAALEHQMEIEIAALRNALASVETMRERLDVVGTWYVSQAGEGRRRMRAIAEIAMLASTGEARARMQEQRRFLHHTVAGLLRQQEIELGAEFHMPTPALATAVLALLDGFALCSALEDGEVDGSPLVTALELLLRPADPGQGRTS